MEWWQIVLVAIATVVSGTLFGILLILMSYLRKRYISKTKLELVSAQRTELVPEEERSIQGLDNAVILSAAKEADKTHNGFVTLLVVLPVDRDQVEVLVGCLDKVQDLSVAMVGDACDVGAKIVVYAEKPVQLLGVLAEMPPVKDLLSTENEILLELSGE